MTNIEQQARDEFAKWYSGLDHTPNYYETWQAAWNRRAQSTSIQNIKFKFKLGDHVTKIKGSQWTGYVVGTYSTKLTPEGYAVESSTETGSVQIYPAAALARANNMDATTWTTTATADNAAAGRVIGVAEVSGAAVLHKPLPVGTLLYTTPADRVSATGNADAVCSCPSGDGSLRWPCAQHPPVDLNGWIQGAPSGFRAEEWFIAQTIYGDRVVLRALRALPKGHTYDFKTADNTYIARDKIAKWMPFPDSEFTPPATRVTVSNEDLVKINRWLLQREKHRMAGDIHRAIYRLVQAVKGEK